MARKKKQLVFEEDGSWNHFMNVLRPDGTTESAVRGGFKSKEEAEESYKICNEQYREVCRNLRINSDMDIAQYLRVWFEEIQSPKVLGTTRLIESFIIYERIIPRLEQPVKIRFLNRTILNELLTSIKKSSLCEGDLARGILISALDYASVHGYIKGNPARETNTIKRPKPKVRILSKTKLKEFLKVASNSGWYLEILLATLCGLRKGEILALTFADFDRKAMTVTIDKQITTDPDLEYGTFHVKKYGVVKRLPKTDAGNRTIRVNQAIINELEKRRIIVEAQKIKMGDRYHDSGLISCQTNGLPHALSAFNTALTKMCNHNALPHLTPHGLRHQCATMLLEKGVQVKKISAILGHKSVKTTLEHYCEVMDEEDRILGFINETFRP